MAKRKTLPEWKRQAQALARELSLTQLELGRLRQSYDSLRDLAMSDPPVRGNIEFVFDNEGSYQVTYESFLSLVRYVAQATEPLIIPSPGGPRLEFGFRRLRSIRVNPSMPYRGPAK